MTCLWFGFLLFGLLYPLPSTRSLLAVGVWSTAAYVLLVALTMVHTSGQRRLFALPACLFIIYIPVFCLMLHSAASTYVDTDRERSSCRAAS